MVNRMLQPQEIEVFYVLPAVRRELSLAMKSFGRSQKDIAKLLGVTEPAVSQYLSSKRASFVKFDAKIKNFIYESAKRIKCELTLMREMQRLIAFVHSERLICRVHKSLGCPSDCTACFGGKK